MFGYQNRDMVWLLISRVLVIFLVLPIHEAAHAWMASRLGDPTAKRLGRITLNPLKHLDKIGFITMLLFGFGWEKPVPVDTRYFKNPQKDNALVALAGPVSNFLMAFVVLFIEGVLLKFVPLQSTIFYYLILILHFMAYTSIFLGVFNLLPVPPLDGFNVLGGILPKDLYYKIYGVLSKYGMLIVFALMWMEILSVPVNWITDLITWVFTAFLNLIGLPVIY